MTADGQVLTPDSGEEGGAAGEPAASTAPKDGRPAGERARALAVLAAPALLCAAVMALVGAWGLGRRDGMGNDEVVTRWVSGLSLHQLKHLLGNLDAVHGFYYLCMHVWVKLAGNTPSALRVPSLVAAVIAAGVVYLLARRLTGSVLAGIAAGLTMALTPSISYYAQTARSYAVVYLGVVLATWVFVCALAAERRARSRLAIRWWIAYAVIVVFAGYLNEMALLMLLAHAVTVALAGTDRRVQLRWLIWAVCGAVPVAPLVWISHHQTVALDFLTKPGWSDVQALGRNFFGAAVVVALVVALLAIFALLPALGRVGDGQDGARWRGEVTVANVAVPLLVIPSLVLFVASYVFRPLFIDRYVLWSELGVALLAGAGVARLARVVGRAGRPQLRVAISSGLVVVLAAGLLFGQLANQRNIRTPGSRQFDFGGPAHVVARMKQPGDGVLFFDSFYRKTRLGYPGAFRGVQDFAMAVTPVAAGNYRGTDKPLPAVVALLAKQSRVWVVGVDPTQATGPRLGPEAQALMRDFEKVYSAHFHRVNVTLWRHR